MRGVDEVDGERRDEDRSEGGHITSSDGLDQRDPAHGRRRSGLRRERVCDRTSIGEGKIDR